MDSNVASQAKGVFFRQSNEWNIVLPLLVVAVVLVISCGSGVFLLSPRIYYHPFFIAQAFRVVFYLASEKISLGILKGFLFTKKEPYISELTITKHALLVSSKGLASQSSR